MKEKRVATKRTAAKTATKSKTRKVAAVEAVVAIADEAIAQRAYMLWEFRGRPIGSPEEDWRKAMEQLRDGLN